MNDALRPDYADAAAGMDLMPAGSLPAMLPANQGDVSINTFGSLVTAQRVAVPRNHNRIVQQLKALCAMSGDSYIYSWEVNDKRNQRKVTIEGPTVKLANDLARAYGNCLIDVRVMDGPEHWTFYARFTDVETGFSYTRPFQQRKGQDIGSRYDADRARDMIFQIGASKAIRNAVVNALSTYVDFMMEESRNCLLQRIEEQPDKAHAFILKVMEKYSIGVSRVEAVVGRLRKDWTVRDLAKVYSEMRGIAEGMTVADEVYPSEEAAAQVTAEKKERAKGDNAARAKLDDVAGGGKAEEKKPEPKREEPKQPEAEQKPEPQPERKPEAAAAGGDGEDDGGKPKRQAAKKPDSKPEFVVYHSNGERRAGYSKPADAAKILADELANTLDADLDGFLKANEATLAALPKDMAANIRELVDLRRAPKAEPEPTDEPAPADDDDLGSLFGEDS